MIRNILLTVEYDGTDFSGWQIQPESRTVQGELQKAVNKICGKKSGEPDMGEFKVDGTSRTDAGVHAFGQRASFKGDFGIPVDKIRPVLNNLLPADIRISEVEEMSMNFHARYDSKGKKYVYKIKNTEEKDVFNRNYYYFVKKSLDVKKMKEAAKYIEGTHDFAAFMAMGSTPQKTTVRTIYFCEVKWGAEIGKSEDEIHIEIGGDGFLYNMVRIITGTLIEVGTGKISCDSISDIIKSQNRSKAGHTAPPQGLYLAEVYYNIKLSEKSDGES